MLIYAPYKRGFLGSCWLCDISGADLGVLELTWLGTVPNLVMLSNVQYIVCIELHIYGIKSEEQIEKLRVLFLSANHKLCSQKVFAMTQQRIFDALVFMSCKTIFLQTTGAAD